MKKNYILMFVSGLLSQRETPTSEIELEDIISNDVGKKKSGLNKIFPSVRKLTRTLIDAMGFDYASEVHVGSDVSVPLTPLEGNPVVRISAMKVLFKARLKFLKESNFYVADTCHIMEEFALAYRLAAHFTLISCSRLREYHKKNYKVIKSLTKIQNRALLTLLVSLRGLLVALLREELNANQSGSAVSSNIRSFFQADSEDFSPAEVLWTDCANILTGIDPDIGMLDDKANAHLVETLLKLDKEVSTRQDVSFSAGLMELLFRQLIAKEVTFTGAHGPIKSKMEKLSGRVRKYSGALACVLDNPSRECNAVIKNLLRLRRSHCASVEEMEERNNQIPRCLRMKGCIFLSKVIDQYKVSENKSTIDPEEIVQTQTMEQMTFYLFHLLVENDPFPQLTADGAYHPNSTSRRLNLKSAVVAALLLASKALESPISMRRLLIYASNASEELSQDTVKGGSGRPLRDLTKSYERHLMILHAYDAPELSRLSYSSITEVSELLSLSDVDTVKFKLTFDHFGVKYSPSCLIEEPLLLAFAVYRFGCKHLHIMRSSVEFDEGLETGEKRMVELLANQMKATFVFYLSQRDASQSTLSSAFNLPPHVSDAMVISPSDLCDQLNSINES